MNNEIKEILDYMQEYIKPFNHDSEPMLNSKDVKLLLDYITNLEEELEKIKLENKVLKEQMVAMVQPNYVYGISGGSNE